jgi:hypothetical protein
MVVLFGLIACSETDENTQPLDELYKSITTRKSRPEIDGAVQVKDVTDSVCCPVMINMMDPEKGEQQWLAMEAETYCESYGIAYIRPDYKTFPSQLNANTVSYKCLDGQVCNLSLKPFVEHHADGMVFWRPDSIPLFVPASDNDSVFNSSAAEIYYRFTFQDSGLETEGITPSEYIARYNEMIPEIKERYHFGEIAKKMRSRDVNYMKEGGLGNIEVAKIYFSLKYLLGENKTEIIAYNLIHYPLAYTENGENVPVKSPEEFIVLSDRIFSKDFRENFLRTDHYRLLGVDKRVMVGENLMFFARIDGGVKIVEINN